MHMTLNTNIDLERVDSFRHVQDNGLGAGESNFQ